MYKIEGKCCQIFSQWLPYTVLHVAAENCMKCVSGAEIYENSAH